MPVQAPKRLFTAGEFHQMADARIFRDDDRLELLVGEIVEMTPIGRRHAGCVNYLNRVFSEAFGSAVIVSVQNPLCSPYVPSCSLGGGHWHSVPSTPGPTHHCWSLPLLSAFSGFWRRQLCASPLERSPSRWLQSLSACFALALWRRTSVLLGPACVQV